MTNRSNMLRSARRRRGSLQLWQLLVPLLVAALASSVVNAHAAGLGGASSEELFSAALQRTPAIVSGEVSFEDPGPLVGTPAGDTGGIWEVPVGGYNSNGSTLQPEAGLSVAVVNVASNIGAVTAELIEVQGRRSGGVAANVSADGRRFVGAVTEQPNGGRVRLLFVDGTQVVELAVATQVGSVTSLGIARTPDRWVVTANGAVVIDHPISAALMAAVGPNTRFGLFNNGDLLPHFASVSFS